MLAAHRDQENLVHNHQAVNKQHPKTPGARYPKTPTAYANNDENAVTRTAKHKTAVTGAVTLKGKNTAANRDAMVTPMENRTRAPLGNKTTNAKAGTVHTVGVKDRVKQIERTHGKAGPAIQKSSKKLNDAQAPKLRVQADAGAAPGEELPEPEYAPPTPVSLPYESDVLPKGGLTCNGLQSQNLFKGFYQHFHNPVDENGVSRVEKKFQAEMEDVFKKAEERNAQDMKSITWNPEHLAEDTTSSAPTAALEKLVLQDTRAPDGAKLGISARNVKSKLSTISSRRAASALAAMEDKGVARPAPSKATAPARRPLSTLVSGSKPARPIITAPKPGATSTGEVASRTTLGYNKGRTASSMVHSTEKQRLQRSSRANSPLFRVNSCSGFTNSPLKTCKGTQLAEAHPSPRFVSIFDESADGDLPPLRQTFEDSCDDDEEEFQLRFDI